MRAGPNRMGCDQQSSVHRSVHQPRHQSAPGRSIVGGLAVAVPGSSLGPITTNEMWDEVYNRLVELIEQHRSTLVFVNTRRLAERIAHHLGERLGEDNVAAHHGSLSRKLRLSAEQKLKEGKVKVLVATASAPGYNRPAWNHDPA